MSVIESSMEITVKEVATQNGREKRRKNRLARLSNRTTDGGRGAKGKGGVE